MRAYSKDLRERVVEAYEKTPVIAEVARRFKISYTAARTYIRAHQAGQSLTPKPRPGRARKLGTETHQMIRDQVAVKPLWRSGPFWGAALTKTGAVQLKTVPF